MSTACRCCCCPATSSPTAGPIPVLQQVEDFGDGTVSANDCFRPVSRYFDRITRPEQIIPALHRAMQVLTDPAECGPVTLSLCQDVQAEAYDYPESFFAERIWTHAPPARPTTSELAAAVAAAEARAEAADHRRRRRALFAGRRNACRSSAEAHGIPVGGDAGRQVVAAGRPSAQHGRGRRHRHLGRQRAGARRPTWSSPSAPGCRISPPARGRCSRTPAQTIIGLNTQLFDAGKHRALPLVADARAGLEELDTALGGWTGPRRLDRRRPAGKRRLGRAPPPR